MHADDGVHVATAAAAKDIEQERQRSNLPTLAPTVPDLVRLSDTIVLLAAKTVVGEMEYVSEERFPLASVSATSPVKAMQVSSLTIPDQQLNSILRGFWDRISGFGTHAEASVIFQGRIQRSRPPTRASADSRLQGHA